MRAQRRRTGHTKVWCWRKPDLLLKSPMMSNYPPVSLGRESPHRLQSFNKLLLVFYRDAVALFQSGDNEFELKSERVTPCEAAVLLPSGRLVISLGSGLSLLGLDLEPLAEMAGQGEDIVDLVALDGRRFLSQDEDGTISCWEISEDDQLVETGRWPIECTPLFAAKDGKTVVCAERGRIQERDSRNGTVTTTWPKTATAVWGIAEPNGFQAHTIDEAGTCWLWDIASREALFALDPGFPAVRACFNEGGTAGAILGQSGEVSHFKVVEGGACTEISVPGTPLVSLTFFGPQLVGLDENGGLWELGEEEPKAVGGSWADWATCCCFCPPDRIYVGTATGSLETFHPDGKRLTASLQVHQDALVGIEPFAGRLFTLGADASVCRIENPGRDSAVATEVAEYPGQSVVSHAFHAESGTLWMGLEDGLVVALTPDGKDRQVQLEGRRVEEIQSAGAEAALVLTDRGSVRYLRI